MRNPLLWSLLAGCALLAFVAGADEPSGSDEPAGIGATQDRSAENIASLARFQDYVGSWRGVGQLRRGSSEGAWTEESQWAWQFEKDARALGFATKKGKYFASGALRPTDKADHYELRVRFEADGPEFKYHGQLDEKDQLVLVATEAAAAPEKAPHRVSFRLIANGDRLVVLYEQRTGEDRYRRLAEVGYTREGSRFGKGTSYVECVVTGGKGTIPVTHEGKTYYVCCTGCRDYFNDDPDHVLAEYRKRKEKEKQQE